MSVLAGIWHFDGRPVDHALLQGYSNSLAKYAPDGEDMFLDGAVGMLYRTYHRTSDSRLERQPHISAKGRVITWEGRLDNREDLAILLTERPSTMTTDIDVVAAAFDRWGTECFARFIGDWAFAAWNPGDRILTLAIDCMAIKHLYYCVKPDSIVWCSDLETLVLQSRDRFDLDQEYVAGYFAYKPAPGRTPYSQVGSVKAGSVVQIRNGRVASHSYWKFNPKSLIRYRADADYEEHFLHVFRQAVRRRLHSDAPVLADLSGGLDSSSIVCLADDIMSREGAETPRLDTYSHFDLGEPNGDDLPYIAVVEAKRDRIGHHLNIAEQSNPLLPDHRDFVVAPGSLGSTWELRRRLEPIWRTGGYKAAICGIGGDEVTGGVPDPRAELADLLLQLRLFEFVRKTTSWSLVKRNPWIRLAFRSAALLMPAGIRARAQEAAVAPWIDRRFANTWRISRRQLGPTERYGFWLPSRQETARTLIALARNQGNNFQCTSGLVERRYPFLDQDLIEFILSIPRDQLLRPGERRSLMRRALKGLVPNEILSRKTKGTVSRRPLLAVANDWNQLGDLLDDSVMAHHGFVDQPKLRDALLAAKAGDAPQLLQLLSTISLELWLRDMARRGLLRCANLASEKDRSVTRAGLRTENAPTNIEFLTDAEASSLNANHRA